MRPKLRTATWPATLLALVALAACGPAMDDNSSPPVAGKVVPAAEIASATGTATSEVAVLAGGCFWGVEGVFEHVKGVTEAESGYAGGNSRTASYADVSNGTTAHAESVRVTFDPRVVSYAQLLQIYFAVAHDPTELDRQGPDTGPQYRSTIFPTDAAQSRIAQAYIAQLVREKVFGEPVVTTIETGKRFYPAEEVHQDFMALYPENPYIVANDAPKLVALARTFPDRYRS